MAGLALGSLVLLVIWNGLDPSPPAWDEAQHLLMAQAFGDHLRQFRWDPEWWGSFWHLSQRYPPLTYWLGLLFSPWRIFGRAEGQLINLVLLGIGAAVTQRIGALSRGSLVGWLGAGLILLYPSITGLAHVYMTDLPLVVAVAVGFWGALRYWQQPGWISGIGLGIAIGLVMLTKWNGILFLVWPLALIGARILIRRQWHQILHLLVMIGITMGICWGWYGANWVFVISNGLNYTATTHYYVECPAGSWCWWTIYLRLLPEQMSPILCGLPLLILIPRSIGADLKASRSKFQYGLSRFGGGSEAWLISTYLVGYLIYTLIGIKTVRFTMPVLPLLAVISAIGIGRLQQRWPWGQRSLRVGMILIGILALFWSGQPLTPGVTALARSFDGDQPQAELIRWLHTQADPQDPQRTLMGVLPNTELISSETLSYLARLEHLPLSFAPLGQSEWPDLETSLVDQHLNSDGDWGVIGPYGPSKEAILEILQTSPDWQAKEPIQVNPVGELQTFVPSQDRVRTQVLSQDQSKDPQLLQVRSLRACEISQAQCLSEDPQIAAWEMTWRGAVGDLSQTAVWVDWVQDEQVIGSREFAVGEGHLRRDRDDPVWVTHRFSWRSAQPLNPGDYQLKIRWQTAPETTTAQLKIIPVKIESIRSLNLPADPLRQTAEAMAVGDLDQLSKYLNVWTTLRHDPGVIDPDLDLQRRLLKGRLQQTQALEDQLLIYYQLGLIAVTQLRAKEAQTYFEILTQLQPENYWNRGYVAFLRLLFTHDLTNLQEEIQAVLYPFYSDQSLCQPAEDGSQTDICRLLEEWDLLPSQNSSSRQEPQASALP